MKWKFGEVSTVTSEVAKAKWPYLVIDFLENNLLWVRNYGKVLFVDNDVGETDTPIGRPIQITCMYYLFCILINITQFKSIFYSRSIIFDKIFQTQPQLQDV